MTITLEAPWSAPATVTLLPNPILEDTEGLDVAINLRQAMDGTPYTYVQSSDRKVITYEFEDVGRGKLLEVQEFVRLYAGQEIKITDYRGDVWRATIDSPIEFVTNSKSTPKGSVRQESGLFSLTFTGVKQ